jgi:hypothetical protein
MLADAAIDGVALFFSQPLGEFDEVVERRVENPFLV